MLQKVVLCAAVAVFAAQALAEDRVIDEPVKACAPGQQKAMIAYEFSDDGGTAFGNVFVCTSRQLNTEAGINSLRDELRTRHKGAIILSITPLAS